jgi:predicted MFS family arabinose efflux permease
LKVAAMSEQKSSFIGIQWLLGAGCGALIANIYYAQPLTGLISSALGIHPQHTGLIMTLALLGYGIGLLTVVPLGDLIENRRLVLVLVALEALCMMAFSFVTQPTLFLTISFLVGLAAAVVQVLVPYVTYLVPVEVQGQALGNVVSGIMLGIMLARPISSLAADYWSWHAIFRISAGLMAILFVSLRFALPERRPVPGLTYRTLLTSMGHIFVSTTILRRRALYHACMFGAFSVFWTAIPLWLSGPDFGLTQKGIAGVALAGVAGAVAPPIAGKIADRGLSQLGTMLAMLFAVGAFLLSDLARNHPPQSLWLVVAAAILLDFCVSANLVFGQRAIFALEPVLRSRINGLFMATFFAGGAIGAALSGWCFTHYGWQGVTIAGCALPCAGLIYLATDRPPALSVKQWRAIPLPNPPE